MISTRVPGLAAAFVAAIAFAQPRADPPAVSYFEGKLYVDDRPVLQPAALAASAVVRTEAGRGEIRMRGGFLYLGENTSVRVLDDRPNKRNRLEVLAGSAVLITEKTGAHWPSAKTR